MRIKEARIELDVNVVKLLFGPLDMLLDTLKSLSECDVSITNELMILQGFKMLQGYIKVSSKCILKQIFRVERLFIR